MNDAQRHGLLEQPVGGATAHTGTYKDRVAIAAQLGGERRRREVRQRAHLSPLFASRFARQNVGKTAFAPEMRKKSVKRTRTRRPTMSVASNDSWPTDLSHMHPTFAAFCRAHASSSADEIVVLAKPSAAQRHVDEQQISVCLADGSIESLPRSALAESAVLQGLLVDGRSVPKSDSQRLQRRSISTVVKRKAIGLLCSWSMWMEHALRASGCGRRPACRATRPSSFRSRRSSARRR